MTAELPQAELDRIRDWTERQLAGGRELPWRAFLLTRLGETIDALLDGMADTLPMRSTPRLVVSNPAPSERPPIAKQRPGDALRSGRLTKTLATGPVA